MKRNGFTSAHHQRYRCTRCNRSHIRHYDDTSWRIRRALNWLVSKNTQEETGISARSLRRDTQLLWQCLPVPRLCEEYYPIIHVDGIHLHHHAVILIAYAQQHVLAWSVARRECAAAYRTLFSYLPTPRVLVCDGGAGIFTAVKDCWPGTRIQRCLFHMQMNISHYTTRNPRLDAGKDLHVIMNRLPYITNSDERSEWYALVHQWEVKYKDFFEQMSRHADGNYYTMHQRLYQARNILRTRIRQGNLFTYIDVKEEENLTIPPTNNAIESFNAKIRSMLRLHRGMSITHQIKAVCWFCYLHTLNPEPISQAITRFPTNDMLIAAAQKPDLTQTYGIPALYDKGIDWNDYHRSTPYHP